MFELKELLIKEKDKFHDKEYLNWLSGTYPRNYPEFLEMDLNKATDLAKTNFKNDLDFLTQYISDLNSAFKFAKKYLELED